MQIDVVINCGAGSVDGDAVEAERQRVLDAFAPLGVEASVRAVGGMAVGLSVRMAADRGADVVVVAGGDGTLGTAADALAGTGTPLGILPLGTFNHFAKDLGIPIDVARAAEVIVDGQTVAVDVAEVNGRTFVNNSSIGLYPVMVDLRDEIRSTRGWGKVRAVPLASWRVLRRFPTRRLQIEVDGQTWDQRSPFVFVGNNTYEIGPRGIGARTEIARGVLCCYVAKAETRRRFVRLAVGAALRGATATPHLDSACAPEVTIDAHGHRVLVAVDGEVDTVRGPLRYRSRPGALLVRVPADADPPTGPPEAPEAEAGVEEDAEG
ncbi:MAG TPA: diacylglycerol kinase family protein [Iamia sp.]|nr:diacylglycerol kinase family protein [Iamia sp.]